MEYFYLLGRCAWSNKAFDKHIFFSFGAESIKVRKMSWLLSREQFLSYLQVGKSCNFPKIWTVFKMNYTLFCYKNIFYKYIEADIKEIFRILTSYYNRARGPYRGILARGRGSSDRPRANNPQYGSS